MFIDVNNIDFVDFGSKTGGSLSIGRRMGGQKGLGIELRQRMVDEAVKNGLNVVQGDVFDLKIPDKSVRFTILNHFLEHLPSLKEVRLALNSAVRISTDCIYIGGPTFDDDEYLESLGLRTFWAHWKGHPCHLTLTQLQEILHDMGFKPQDYKINEKYKPYEDSSSPVIHPLDSPIDQHDYNPDIHPPKPYVKFKGTLYGEWKCVVSLDGTDTYFQYV